MTLNCTFEARISPHRILRGSTWIACIKKPFNNSKKIYINKKKRIRKTYFFKFILLDVKNPRSNQGEMDSFWSIPAVHTDLNIGQLSRLEELSNQVTLAMSDNIPPSDNVKAYRKNDKKMGIAQNLREMLERKGTVLMQYDGRNQDCMVTKNFQARFLSSMLRQEASLHLGERDLYESWVCPNDRDFSPYHGYYNIEGGQPVKLFVDFDQPDREPALMKILAEDPSHFWAAIQSFIRSLVALVPGYQSDWVAVFKSGGTKLSAHIHDLRMWSHDVSSFQDLVESACALDPVHRTMLQNIVDTRVYHGSRAWRMPGHCKRSNGKGGTARFLSLGPDPDLSGSSSLKMFDESLSGDRNCCIAWAAFCHPHVFSSITLENGCCIKSNDCSSRVAKRVNKAPDVARPLKIGKTLVASWL
jgi:hypothetical protein